MSMDNQFDGMRFADVRRENKLTPPYTGSCMIKMLACAASGLSVLLKTATTGRKRRRWPYVTVAVLTALAALADSTKGQVENNLPVATNASYLLEPGTSMPISLSAADADGDTLSYIVTALPTSGTVFVGTVVLGSSTLPYTIPNNGRDLTYTAAAGASGSFSLKFKANDGTGDSNLGTITLTVNLAPQPVDKLFITEPNTDLKIEWPVTDAATDTLSYTIISLPGHGQVKIGKTALNDADLPYLTDKGDVLYTPDEDYHGHDAFTFFASDGLAQTDVLTVEIEANTTPIPDPVSVTVLPDGRANIEFSSVDADRDPVRYVIVSLPAHGILSDQGAPITENSLPKELAEGVSEVEYTVDVGYRGTDGFQYRVRDYISTSNRVTVKIVVNTPPQASGTTLSVTSSGTVEAVLLPIDDDGDALRIQFPQLPAIGTLSIGGRAVSRTDTFYDVPAAGLVVAYTPNTPEPTDAEGSDSSGEESTTGNADTGRGEDTETGNDQIMNQQDSFTWLATDGKENSDTVTVLVNLTDQSGTSDNSSSDGDVLSSTPSATMGACGAAGVAELCLLAVPLFIAPRARFLRKLSAGW